MTNALEETLIKMMSSYPYYSNLIQQMDKKLTRDVPIAAVSVTSRINLYINPDTFGKLPMNVRVGVLLHECYHILHDHIGRSKSVAKKFNKALNIAADRAINEHLHTVAKNGSLVATIPDRLKVEMNGKVQEMRFVTKKNFQDTYKGKLIKDNETMEYYYKFLKDNAQKSKDGSDDFGGDMDTVDDHDKWEEGGSTPEEVREVVKGAVNKAAQKTAAGSIPADVQTIINELNKSVVSWQHILQRFVAKCTNVTIDSSRKRRNRRYGLIHAGIKKEPELRLGIAIDTSGSVHDKYLQQFFSEVKKIHGYGIEVLICEADADVQNTYEYDPKKPIAVKGRGGTMFQPAITKLEQAKVDGIIYLTDGENYSEDLKIKLPILWGLCPSYTIPKGAKEKDCIKITLPEEKSNA